jgi:cytochrome d ubiquinol oxidase subunit I
VIVAIGTLMSAFWILSANSWMQTPAGFRQTPDGLEATRYWDVIFNPSFPIRYVHMVLAAYLTTALVIGGACAYQFLRRRGGQGSIVGLRMGILMLAIVAPVQILAGHESGGVAHEHQPAKVAAMEGWWETLPEQRTVLFGFPDEEARKNHFELAIPNTSGLLFDIEEGEPLLGLDAFAPQDRPPVWPVFWSFRIMVAIGLLMVVFGWWGAWMWARGRLEQARALHWVLAFASPLGFVAILAGWIAAEIGRQPYVIYGVLRTADAVSPVTTGEVATSLLFFLASYAIIFTAGAIYTVRLIAQGPETDAAPISHDVPPGSSLGAVPRSADAHERPPK